MLGRIMVNTSLPRHPKLFALAAYLKVNWPTALGHVVAIWCEVMAQKEGGVLEGWARGDLERVSGWRGKAGLLAEGLLATGWIDNLADGKYAIHDWSENQGNILEDRRYDAWRKRVDRAHKKGLHLPDCPDVCRTSGGRAQDISVPIPPLPIPPLPIPPKEKREAADAALPPPLAAQGDAPERPAEDVDKDFPLGGGSFPMAPELEAVFAGIPRPSNGAVKHPEPTPQDTVIRILMRAATGPAKMPNKPATIRPVLEAMRARYGAQRVEEWLMNPANIGKNTIEMQDELKVLHKGNDVASKVKLQATNDRRVAARSQVLQKIQDFLQSHSKGCSGCRDCNRDRIALVDAGIPKSQIPQPKKKE